MKKILFTAAALLMAVSLSAQTREAFNAELGGRFSVELDKKIAKGWHVYLNEEVRLDENITTFDRFHTTLGTSYKFNSFLKGGIEYSLINHYKPNAKEWQNKHRLSLYLTERFKTGDWTLSLKETFRFTHKAYENNTFQSPRNPLNLKVRFQAQYGGFHNVEPYAGIEGRLLLNGATCSATYYSASDTWGDYSFTGYGDVYVNRIRGFAGLEWKLTRKHTLDFRLLADYLMDKEIDTNSEGTELKSMVLTNKLFPQLCIGYKFSF